MTFKTILKTPSTSYLLSVLGGNVEFVCLVKIFMLKPNEVVFDDEFFGR